MVQPNPFSPDQIVQQLAERFTLREELRVGGQGVVYRAERMRAPDGSAANDHVALKLHFAAGQEERVEREIRAMERLRHPNLANLIEHGTIQLAGKAVRYAAWEYVEGAALDTKLRDGPLPPRVVACIGRDVARALDHIWSQERIVHRDVNPKNIMLRTGDREAVLIDLGVARHLTQETITTAGTTWGTMGYFSPEQCRAETQLTCQSDVFSLGVVLQEALTGKHPTNRDQRALVSATPTTGRLAANIPVELAEIIDSMLRPRAAFRPQPSVLAAKFGDLADRL